MFVLFAITLLPLLDDRPPLTDLEWFPLVAVVEEQLCANRLYSDYLECRLYLASHLCWDHHTALAETRQLREAWETLRWAHVCYSPKYRRDMLKHLRDLLGPEAYYTGRMPPCLPLHRLVPRD